MAARNGRGLFGVRDIVRSYVKTYGNTSGVGVSCDHFKLLDESQCEVSKKSVKLKRFKTKEEAQAFKDDMFARTGEVWSDIKDSPKGGVFVGYCRAGQLAVEAVTQSGKDFDMEVDLTAGYMIGNNWRDCH